MKYYKLKKDLPTFKKGELFYLDDSGSLVRAKDDLMVCYYKTIKKFPNILKDWFEPASEPERDKMTKWKFFEYLQFHKDERFLQAVRNFTKEYIDDDVNFLFVSKHSLEDYIRHYDKFYDTFYWECDEKLKKKETKEKE